MSNKKEPVDTKVTHLGHGIYGCRIIDTRTGRWIVEAQVQKHQVSGAFKSMFRTLDKLGYDSDMMHSSRMRDTPYFFEFKYIWNDSESRNNQKFDDLNTGNSDNFSM